VGSPELEPELDGRARAHEPQLEEGRPVVHEKGACHETAQGTRKLGKHVHVPALAHGKSSVEGTRSESASARGRPPAERGLGEGGEAASAAGRRPKLEAGDRELRALEEGLERAAGHDHAWGCAARARTHGGRGGAFGCGAVKRLSPDEPDTLEKQRRARCGEVAPEVQNLEPALLASGEAEARRGDPA